LIVLYLGELHHDEHGVLVLCAECLAQCDQAGVVQLSEHPHLLLHCGDGEVLCVQLAELLELYDLDGQFFA
jgi:hypothetical protein